LAARIPSSTIDIIEPVTRLAISLCGDRGVVFFLLWAMWLM
jgi:hypothetical protein